MGLRKPKSIKHNGKSLVKILEAHERFFTGKDGGSRADLTGADRSQTDLSEADRSAGQRRGIFPLRPFKRGFPARSVAQCESAIGERERGKILGRRYGRSHSAGDGFGRRGSFRRRPLYRAAPARL